MKKNVLLATAVASILASGLASADVKLSGLVEVAYKDMNAGTSVAAGDVELKASSATDLGNGSTAFASYRIDAKLSGSANSADAVTVGLKGDWGTFMMGEAPAGTSFAEVAGDINGDPSPELAAAIAYVGTAGDITFAVGMVPSGSSASDATTMGFSYKSDMFTLGAGSTTYSNDTKDTLVGISTSFEAFTVGFMTGDMTDKSADAIKLGWSEGDISANYIVANNDNVSTSESSSRLTVVYNMGGGTKVIFRAHSDAAGTAKDYNSVELGHSF